MRTVGLFEAKQKLSELIERASEGERTGITRRGKLAAIIIPAQADVNLETVFEDIESVRKRVRKPKSLTIKQLIDEGRV